MDEIKQEEMENDEKTSVDLIRRVPVKIAVHSGLRNTYNLLTPRLPPTRKVLLKPPRASPNLKMIRPADIVNGETREIIGRLTFQKIKALERESSAKFIVPKLVVVPKSAKSIMLENLRIRNMKKKKKMESSISTKNEDEYWGVPMMTPLPKEYDSDNFKLSKVNPKLAARLARFINFKKPDVKPSESDYPDYFPEILRCRNFEPPIDPEFLLNSLMEPPEIPESFGMKEIKKEDPDLFENDNNDKIWFRNGFGEEEDVKFDILDKI
ncbi:unnamed protein product [Caenorhabditis angaria]|uniref:Uncharacterized protein n=1 Tax=Caenorhabditis angaria TaxID=860376 RepID=A0A9P1J0U9_9PELO|nr:unnamed protein product [Caenorhabditis angaria]